MTRKTKMKLSGELTQGDMIYLLHVAGNMLEMTQGKCGEADYVRLLAQMLQGLCKKIIYGEKRHESLDAVVYRDNALFVPSLN